MSRGSWWRERSGASSRTSEFELRLPWRLGEELRASLERPGRMERVTLALAGVSHRGNMPVLVPFALRSVPDDQYVASQGCAAAFSHRFIVSVWNEAASMGASVLLFHSHGGSGRPSLSRVDERSFEQLSRVFIQEFGHLALGSIVLSDGDLPGGLVRLPGESMSRALGTARWSGPTLRFSPVEVHGKVPERYSRHDDVWGQAGQRRLAQARVGILGAGGGGSHVIQQLAHAGLGKLVVVDADVLEDPNRSRVVCVKRRDLKKPKAWLLARAARHANEDLQVEVVLERFPLPEAERALRSVDIIVACVDTLHARDEVQRFAWRHAIPLVDIGLSIHPRKDESRLRIGGHVATAIPGGPCLWCMGLLSEEKLAEEGGGRGAAYVTGGGNAQVISFNGVLASAAVNEVLDLLTGFRERDETPARLVFNGMSNTLEECIPTANPTCPVCSEQLGRGVPAWVALPSEREMGTASSKPWNQILAWLRPGPRYT
jgi:hypothetical protein